MLSGVSIKNTIIEMMAANTIIYVAEAHEPEAVTLEEPEPPERVWDKETIKEEIHKVFPNEPVMVDVAWCESRFDPEAFNPTNGSNDQGIFQISEYYHSEHYNRLGLDMFDVEDNIAFARILYDTHGLQPWSASASCW